MSNESQAVEVEALQAVLNALSPLPPETQRRLLSSAAVFLNLGSEISPVHVGPIANSATVQDQATANQRFEFQGRNDLSPKQFMAEKNPRTDVDRVACLAYYLTHYRDQAHFKTLDITKLNREAAQLAISNSARAVSNASRRGLIAPAGKGSKQITVIGEQYVSALPDTDEAKQAIKSMAPKRRKSKSTKAANKK